MSWSSGLRLALVLTSLSLASTAAVESPPLAASEAIRTGRVLTTMFYDGELDTLVSHLTPELRQSVQEEDGLRAFRQRVAATAGRETERLDERVVHWLGGSVIYNRTAHFSETDAPVWVQWTITPDNKASAFFVRPAPSAAPTIFSDYQTRARLRLPFRGPWFVYWGGRTPFENYHVESVTQRFAYDFVRVEDGRTYGSSPHRNESYYCFGEPVLAPASGQVEKAIDGIPDNVPGQMNERQLLGNHVILDHARGEHSFLAHLQQGSVVLGRPEDIANAILRREIQVHAPSGKRPRRLAERARRRETTIILGPLPHRDGMKEIPGLAV